MRSAFEGVGLGKQGLRSHLDSTPSGPCPAPASGFRRNYRVGGPGPPACPHDYMSQFLVMHLLWACPVASVSLESLRDTALNLITFKNNFIDH